MYLISGCQFCRRPIIIIIHLPARAAPHTHDLKSSVLWINEPKPAGTIGKTINFLPTHDDMSSEIVQQKIY